LCTIDETKKGNVGGSMKKIGRKGKEKKKEKLQNLSLRNTSVLHIYFIFPNRPIGGLSLALMSALKVAYYAWKQHTFL